MFKGVHDVHPGELIVFVAALDELAAEHPEIVPVPAHGAARESLVQQAEQEWRERGHDLLPNVNVWLIEAL